MAQVSFGEQFRTKLDKCQVGNKGWRQLVQWMVENSGHCEGIVKVWCEEFRNTKGDNIKGLLQPLNLLIVEKQDHPYLTTFQRVLEETVKFAVEKGALGSNSEALDKLKNCIFAWKNHQKLDTVPQALLDCVLAVENLNKLRSAYPEECVDTLQSTLTTCNNNLIIAKERLNCKIDSQRRSRHQQPSPLDDKADDPASEQSITSLLTTASEGVVSTTSTSSWADQVDAEMGELVPMSPAVSAALKSRGSPPLPPPTVDSSEHNQGSSSSLDQFGNQIIPQVAPPPQQQPKKTKVLSLGGITLLTKHSNNSPKKLQLQTLQQHQAQELAQQQQQQQQATSSKSEREPFVAPKLPVVNPATNQPFTDHEMVQLLWQKITTLEHTCKVQDEEISRLQKLESKMNKLDEFVLETRVEVGKIIQKQLNVERGVSGGDNNSSSSTSTTTARTSKRGGSQQQQHMQASTPKSNSNKHQQQQVSNPLVGVPNNSRLTCAVPSTPSSLNAEAQPFVPTTWSESELSTRPDSGSESDNNDLLTDQSV